MHLNTSFVIVFTLQQDWTNHFEDIVRTEQAEVVCELNGHRLQTLVGQRSEQTVTRHLTQITINSNVPDGQELNRNFTHLQACRELTACFSRLEEIRKDLETHLNTGWCLLVRVFHWFCLIRR